MIQYNNHRITSDSGKYVRRISDGLTATAIAAMTYNADDYEEVDEMPVTVDESAYKAAVERLIRERYTVADELGILRQRDTKPEEFAEYNDFAEACKAEARAEIAAVADEANGK
nr:MAG TPA: hypothetical protein [Bacteriophage sp.]